MTPADLVLLDVGGVLLLPDAEVVAAALQAAGVQPARTTDALEAHYRTVALLDADTGSGQPWDAPLVAAWLSSLGLPVEDPTAAATLREVFGGAARPLWRQVAPWARRGLSALADIGVTLGVVSNADGTVAQQLRDHGLAQVGPGPGTELAVLVDSDVVGVAKPDPGIFDHALAPLDVPAERTWYVGDTVTFDVVGARAAGIQALHLDPHGWCPQPDDHDHVATLDEVAGLVEAPPGTPPRPGER